MIVRQPAGTEGSLIYSDMGNYLSFAGIRTRVCGICVETYVVIVLLHGDDPRNVVECHGAKAEVGVVWDLADFIDERVEVGGGNAVDGGDEVGRREAIVIRRGTAALGDWSVMCGKGYI